MNFYSLSYSYHFLFKILIQIYYEYDIEYIPSVYGKIPIVTSLLEPFSNP
jgi:hypothetical protein